MQGILAKEQSLKAAMATAGYAWADRFPRFSISLQGGFENNALKGFISAPFTYNTFQKAVWSILS